jgi:membrane protein required for colicin V production
VALLDWIGLTVLLLSMLLGVMRGLVFELMSLAGWIAAFLCAQWFAAPVAEWLPIGDAGAVWRYPLAFVLVFIGVAFGVGLVAALTRKMIAAVGLRPVDRMLGAVFGLARGAVALMVAAVVVHLMALSDGPLWNESRGAIVLDEALQAVKPALPEKLASYLP